MEFQLVNLSKLEYLKMVKWNWLSIDKRLDIHKYTKKQTT